MPRSDPRLKILLSEGSSLSARQTLYGLGSRHIIDVCDPKPNFCLARFSRFVRKCYRCPAFAADPRGYLDFLRARLQAEKYDVLFPVHDQAFLISRCREELSRYAAVPVADFAAMERLQSKSSFADLLTELGLPQPATRKIHDPRDLERENFPYYLKLPYSTAGCGVWRVDNPDQARNIVAQIEGQGFLGPGKEILVQQPAPGILGVAQAVFQNGRLLAAHTYQARAIGVGGSARARIGVHLPQVLDHLRILGDKLHWHGALMLDFLIDPETDRVSYIECNPRIGETVNALLSGVNLPELLLQVALGCSLEPPPAPNPGTKTHSLVMGIMALAQKGAGRWAILSEIGHAFCRRDIYGQSQDELTRPKTDLASLIPAIFLTGQLLLNPGAAQRIINRAVNDYALTESAIQTIRSLGTG